MKNLQDKEWHQMSADNALGLLDVNPTSGLSTAEVRRRQLIWVNLTDMNRLFHTVPLSGESWLRIASVAILTFTVVELKK